MDYDILRMELILQDWQAVDMTAPRYCYIAYHIVILMLHIIIAVCLAFVNINMTWLKTGLHYLDKLFKGLLLVRILIAQLVICIYILQQFLITVL